jgi:putative colanic acid biosynthesis UDP-glucose lipid carrier transferase
MNVKGSMGLPDRGSSVWFTRLTDAFLVVLAHWLPTLVHPEEAFSSARMLLSTLVAAVIFAIVADANGLYRPISLSAAPSRVESGKVWLSWGITAPILLVLAFATKTSEGFSRVVTLSWFLAAPILINGTRLLVRRTERAMHRRGLATRAVHIVGATKMGALIAQRIMDDPGSALRVAGYYDDRDGERLHPMPEALGPAKGRVDDLVELARAGHVDLVYVALPLRAESRISDIVRKLADSTASVYVVADFLVFDLVHAQWSSVHGLPVVSVFESPFYGANGWLKRAEDIVLGSILLALIAPLMLVIAIRVKLGSAGPVFFRQRRYGLNGEEIRVMKFRSMTVMEDGGQVTQAQKGDQRITPFGATLRRLSLDELPQFINVITGEMSIVGPRPHAVAHNEMYRKMIHGYMLRHKVKPGITGWAQVNGWRGETDTLDKMEQRVSHDLYYIQNWSLLFDLRIIFMTVFGSRVRKNAH